MNYQRYINSDLWRVTRDGFLKRNGRKCRLCGVAKVHVHHLTYARLGHELDEDLMALCAGHHHLVHEYIRKHGHTIHEGTLAFVQEYAECVQGLPVEVAQPIPHTHSHSRKQRPARSRGRQTRNTRTKNKFLREVAVLDNWNKQRRAFIPSRQRMTQEERTAEPHGGPEGRLGGLPIRTVAGDGRCQPREDT